MKKRKKLKKRDWATVKRSRSMTMRISPKTREMLRQLAEVHADGPNRTMTAQLYLAVLTRHRVIFGE